MSNNRRLAELLPASPPVLGTVPEAVSLNPFATDWRQQAHDVVELPPPILSQPVVMSSLVGEEVTISVSEGPADRAYTLAITYRVNGDTMVNKSAAIDLYDTPDTVANKLVAAVNTTDELVAAKTGPGKALVVLGSALSIDIFNTQVS